MTDDGKLRIERVIDATPEAAYHAWTTPALMERWYQEGDDPVARVTQHDLRVGGTFRIEFGTRTPPSGSRTASTSSSIRPTGSWSRRRWPTPRSPVSAGRGPA